MSPFRNLCTLVALLCLTASCSYYSDERDNLRLLNSAAAQLNSDAENSLAYLQQINTSLLSEQEYAYYTLLQARANNLLGANIGELEDEVLKAKHTVLSEYQPDRAAFASFVLGRVYDGQGKLYKAQHEYLQADEWAEKADYLIPNFINSHIPYNIAVLYYLDKDYEKSLAYLKKAFHHINSNSYDYIEELYALELKGLNLRFLGEVDSAAFCFKKALVLAEENGNLDSKIRTVTNQTGLLLSAKEYPLVEKMCNEQLPQCLENGDTLHAGLLYLILSKVYYNTDRYGLALEAAYIAKNKLQGAANWAVEATYKTLIDIENKKGNTSRVKVYVQQLNQLKKQEEVNRKQQEAEVAIATERAIQQGIAVKQALQVADSHRGYYKQLLGFTRKVVVVASLLLAAFGVVVYLKRRKRKKADHEQCREEMLLFLSQQRNVKSITEELEFVSDSECRERMSDALCNLQIILKMSPQLDRIYGRMYYKLRDLYPNLTPDELYIFWLSRTRTLRLAEIRDYLNCPAIEFNRTLQSMLRKVRERSRFLRIKGLVMKYFSKGDDDVPLSK